MWTFSKPQRNPAWRNASSLQRIHFAAMLQPEGQAGLANVFYTIAAITPPKPSNSIKAAEASNY
jgi:hypothetical protein